MKNLIWSCAALLLVGCYDPGATTAPGTGQLPAAPPGAAPKLAGVAAVRSPGTVGDSVVSGVEACLLDRESALCTASAGDGSYLLGPLTPGSRSRIRYAKPGLETLVAEYEIPEHSIVGDVFLFSTSTIDTTAKALGVLHDRSTSGVVISTYGFNYDGIFALEGVRARAIGAAKFVYADATNQLDTSLEATTSNAWGIALGIQPGSVRLELSHIDPTIKCGVMSYDAAALESSFVVETLPDELTLIAIRCFR